ncbi:AbiU2 domain-containing protein [Roseibium alexandrii]|uniref:HEPN AbiU2-like domain-containing protein n=1 Tax=Roseibium alexandrii TaxID=388408 RepID=A0A0M6ZYQ2_9HYPH|nr:hypothetical protein [Roseibium alexandrii]CTQ67170.1 hypothetical protein LAX5112_01246 [Roseibium alexandrii]
MKLKEIWSVLLSWACKHLTRLARKCDRRPWDGWTPEQRLDRAKEVTRKCVDLINLNIALNEANKVIAYSQDFRDQINLPQSKAGHALSLLVDTSLHYEFIRLSALWDSAAENQYSIPTIVELIAPKEVQRLIVDAMPGGLPGNFSQKDEQSQQYWLKKSDEAKAERQAEARVILKKRIKQVRQMTGDRDLRGFRQLRNQHLAHALERLKNVDPSKKLPAILGKETELLSKTCEILDDLYGVVNGSGFTSEKAYRDMWRPRIEELWLNCRFDVPTPDEPPRARSVEERLQKLKEVDPKEGDE